MENAELEFVYFMRGIAGSFTTNLFTLIMNSDIENQKRLSLSFPNEVNVVNKYRNEEGYWQKLQQKMT
jgi:hypothetical protein